MRYCRNCGASNDDAARVCQTCGRALDDNAPAAFVQTDAPWAAKGFCRNCRTEVSPKALACPSCGAPPTAGTAYCQNCGATTVDSAVVCVSCGVQLGRVRGGADGSDKKLVAALTAILLPGIGVHKFILGYTNAGVVMLLVSLLTCGIGAVVMVPISIIEGIIYLTKTDEDFVATYVVGNKPWF